VNGSIIWPNTRVSQHAEVDNAITGLNCHLGRYVSIHAPVVIGDKTMLTDYTRI
jgi:NDP-sugar pyrophosphorylase family protein